MVETQNKGYKNCLKYRCKNLTFTAPIKIFVSVSKNANIRLNKNNFFDF